MSTSKSIEEIVSEFQALCPHTSTHCVPNRCFGACSQDIYTDWLSDTLQAQQDKAEAEKREVVEAIINEVGCYNDGCGCCMIEKATPSIKAVALARGIKLD